MQAEWPGTLGSNENLQPGVAGRSLFYVQDILQSPRRKKGRWSYISKRSIIRSSVEHVNNWHRTAFRSRCKITLDAKQALHFSVNFPSQFSQPKLKTIWSYTTQTEPHFVSAQPSVLLCPQMNRQRDSTPAKHQCCYRDTSCDYALLQSSMNSAGSTQVLHKYILHTMA